jgi:chromosome segregation ATPase
MATDVWSQHRTSEDKMQSKRERHQALLSGRETLTENLAGLRAEQSAALINGTEFAHGADIRAITDDIEALDAAINVASAAADAEEERQRAASNIERRQQDLQQFDSNSDRWLTIIAEVEAAVGTAVARLAELHILASEMESFALPVSGE